MPTILSGNFGCEFFGGPETLEKQGRKIRRKKEMSSKFAEKFAGNFPKIRQAQIKKSTQIHSAEPRDQSLGRARDISGLPGRPPKDYLLLLLSLEGHSENLGALYQAIRVATLDQETCLYQSPPKGAGKLVPCENCRKVPKMFLTLFGNFRRFLPCAIIVEKCRKCF